MGLEGRPRSSPSRARSGTGKVCVVSLSHGSIPLPSYVSGPDDGNGFVSSMGTGGGARPARGGRFGDRILWRPFFLPFGDFCAYGGDDRVRFPGGVLVVRRHVGGIADEQAVVAAPRR